jgi:hypothetical protein
MQVYLSAVHGRRIILKTEETSRDTARKCDHIKVTSQMLTVELPEATPCVALQRSANVDHTQQEEGKVVTGNLQHK